MAKVGKTNAGTVKADAPQLKSRGLKNPVPQNYGIDEASPDMTMNNDGSKLSQKSPPKSGKRQPGKMD